jgi:hypothetical protein
MRTHFNSGVGLGEGGRLLVRLTTPTFHLSLTHFLTTLRIHFGLPHAIIAHFSWC